MKNTRPAALEARKTVERQDALDRVLDDAEGETRPTPYL